LILLVSGTKFVHDHRRWGKAIYRRSDRSPNLVAQVMQQCGAGE
jgi:hypothetical protein